MKNKFLALVCATMMIAGNLFAAIENDTLLTCETVGPDTYSDGTTVLDGECYALVWIEKGSVFCGFNSDGTLILESKNENGVTVNNNVKIIACPKAKDGHCRTALVEIDETAASKLKNGSYALYLLDTRVLRNGVATPAGFENGKLTFVNGYSSVIGSVSAAEKRVSIRSTSLPPMMSGATRQSSAAATASGSAVRTSNSTDIPSDLDQPKITAIKVVGDKVILTVQNLPGRVGVLDGETISDLDPESAKIPTETDGEAETFTVEMNLNECGKFFKAFRK